MEAVAGLSVNTNILCSLYRETGTLWWLINGNVYHYSLVPEVMEPFGYAGLTVRSVDPTMTDWRFQCLVTNTDGSDNVKFGQVTTLTVIDAGNCLQSRTS